MNRTPVCLKLAWETLRRSPRIVVPYLFGSVIMVALEYSFMALSASPDSPGYEVMSSMLKVGSMVSMVFAACFFFYLNTILLKNRKKEQGLFTVLGMDRSHLIRIVFYQLLILYAADMIIGIPAGILVDKAMSLLASSILGETAQTGFHFSAVSALYTVTGIGIIYLLMFFFSALSLFRSSTQDLLKGESLPETEPKNRWLLGLGGLVCLGIGYWMALSVQDPVTAIGLFFIAVLFVIAGTYLTFMYGSLMILKIIQKNPNYYYKTRHFISVSSMKYRMKQNAASLASIAILSTAALVGVSATIMLLSSVDQSIERNYPKDIELRAVPLQNEYNAQKVSEYYSALSEGLKNAPETEGDPIGYISEMVAGHLSSDHFYAAAGDTDLEINGLVFVIDEDSYANATGENLNLQDNQIYGYVQDRQTGDPFAMGDQNMELVLSGKPIESFLNIDSVNNQYGMPIHIFVVKDAAILNSLFPNYRAQITLFTSLSGEARKEMDELLDQGETGYNSVISAIQDSIDQSLNDHQINPDEDNPELMNLGISEKERDRREMMQMFGGMFFIGVYLSLMFVFAVVLIMYYKQLTEGIEDRKRFEILQRAGLEQKQIRKIINDQVMILFFMPLLMCAIHLAFAFPMLSRILQTSGQFDQTVFLALIAGAFGIYALAYLIVYRLSSQTYYAIVREPQPAARGIRS